MSDMNGP